ncbi:MULTISPECIES: PH domain-containing protein [unclassified Nonomuraea]|uniref:PH domain-containing protein n=1 Tax=unclassified Nonomuraea TaxID=2593643 RepID=UPI0033C74F05
MTGWQRLSGRGLWNAAARSLAFVAGAVAALARFLVGQDWEPGGVVAVCAGAAVLIVAGAVAYEAARLRTTAWRLTADRLELRSGVTVRQHRSVPLDRVRSVDLRADPVRRAFGLTVVRVGTGERAAEGSELVLDALDRHSAEMLRRTLLRQDAPAPEDGPLAELRWSWIRYAPLSIWTFTGAAVVLGAAYKGLGAVGLKDFTDRAATGLWGWVSAQPWLAVPLVLTLNAAVGALGAFLLYAESWGRYRLEREPGRLRLRRGLLTTRSLTLEERRLRGVEISEPLLLRLGGGARVKAVATGLARTEDETEDVAALTPPLPRAEAARVAAAIANTTADAGARPGVGTGTGTGVGAGTGTGVGAGTGTGVGAGIPGIGAGIGAGGTSLTAHPAAAGRRRVVRALVATVVLAAGAGLAWWLLPASWPRAWVWAAPVLALPAGLWLAAESRRGLGHALGPRHLVMRRGALVRRTVALDRAGITGWTFRQSFFQRRSGLLTVSACTAAGGGHYEVLDVGRGDGLDLAARAVPGLLEPFLTGGPDGGRQAA